MKKHQTRELLGGFLTFKNENVEQNDQHHIERSKHMKNFSAPKLLRLALTGTHMFNCPHTNDKTPGIECLCWKTEVRKWDARMKLASANRIRKPKPQKIHLVGNHCASKSSHGLTTTSVTTDVTCKQCLKFANRPVKAPKIPKISKKQQKKLAASNSLSISP